MSDVTGWFAARTAGAPPLLQERARHFLTGAEPNGTFASRLAAAAQRALDGLPLHDRTRAAALDLLTADSLLTLALLAQAEESPGALARFAEGIVGRASA